MSSNADINILFQFGINELRAALDSLLERHRRASLGRIAMIALQNDGLVTNCLALKQFFTRYAELDIWLRYQYCTYIECCHLSRRRDTLS